VLINSKPSGHSSVRQNSPDDYCPMYFSWSRQWTSNQLSCHGCRSKNVYLTSADSASRAFGCMHDRATESSNLCTHSNNAMFCVNKTQITTLNPQICNALNAFNECQECEITTAMILTKNSQTDPRGSTPTDLLITD